jgi:hypothetical protein
MSVAKVDGFGVRSIGDGYPVNTERRARFVRMIANGAITAGGCVCIDVTKGGATGESGYGNYVIEAINTAPATSFVVGVSIAAAASGDVCEIQVSGLCTTAKMLDTSDDPGDLLVASGTAGNLTVTTEAEDGPAAALLIVEGGALAANTTVWLLNPANL